MSLYSNFVDKLREHKAEKEKQRARLKLVKTLRDIGVLLEADKCITYPGLKTFMYHLDDFKIVVDIQIRGDLYSVFPREGDGAYGKKAVVEYGDQTRAFNGALGLCDNGTWPDKITAEAIMSNIQSAIELRKNNDSGIQP